MYPPAPTLTPPITPNAPLPSSGAAVGYGASSLAQAAPVVAPSGGTAQTKEYQAQIAALDLKNQEMSTRLAQQQQRTELLEDRLATVSEQLRSTTAQLAKAQNDNRVEVSAQAASAPPPPPPDVVQQLPPPGISGTSNGSQAEPGSVPTQPTPPGGFYAPAVNFIARTTITAQWPINASKPDDIALNVEKLREKLVAAKLGGDGAAQPPAVGIPLPPGPFARYWPAVLVQNDGFQLTCSGELSKSDRKNALAAAMAKAKEQAAELAEAAGCHLGPLASVSGDFQEDPPVDPRMTPPPDENLRQLLYVTVSVTLHFQIAP
jgi:hypothetical protein